MSLPEILGIVGDAVSRRATVESVVGSPIHLGERAFVPVARVQYGFGGGDNLGVLGSGGGMEATPLGVIEIGPSGVSYHPLPGVLGSGEPALQSDEVRAGIFQVRLAGLPACWLLVNGGEAAVVNAPPQASLATLLVQQAATLQVRVRYVVLTGCDYAHAGGLVDILRIFPEATLVAHRSVEHSPSFPPRPVEGETEAWRAHLPSDGVQVGEGFDEQIWSAELGGEPLFLVYAPRRQWTDQLVLFRGALMVAADQGTSQRVPLEVAAQVRTQLLDILSGPYAIHSTLYDSGELVEGLDRRLFQ
jgi:hypothetical protein